MRQMLIKYTKQKALARVSNFDGSRQASEVLNPTSTSTKIPAKNWIQYGIPADSGTTQQPCNTGNMTLILSSSTVISSRKLPEWHLRFMKHTFTANPVNLFTPCEVIQALALGNTVSRVWLYNPLIFDF